jgi:hypothetical protein
MTYTYFQLDVPGDYVHSSDFESIVKSYMEALEAGGRIELFNLELFPPLPTMDSFLRNTQSLSNLYLAAKGWNDNAVQLETLKSAFACNTCIQTLTLGGRCNSETVTASFSV